MSLMPALLLAALLQSVAGLMSDPDQPSPFPASDSESDIAAKVAELRAFFGSSEQDTRQAIATAQQRALFERLEARHAARLAGVWVENDPGWHIVVRLTGDAPVADEVHGGADGPQCVHFRTGAALTEAEMLRRMQAQRAWIHSQIPQVDGLALDVKTGELVLDIEDDRQIRAAVSSVRDHLEVQLGYPVRINWQSASSQRFPL